jgi:hypothetical protein
MPLSVAGKERPFRGAAKRNEYSFRFDAARRKRVIFFAPGVHFR